MSVPPPRPLRTKRNFKELQLPSASPSPNLSSLSLAVRKPPPAATKAPTPKTPIPPSGDTPVTPQQRSAIRATITQTIAGFPRKNLDLQNEKLVHIREIGQGNGGSVSLVRHRDTDIIMAKKIVLIDAKPSIRKQVVRELQIMHECDSKYIIECFGSYLADPNICICMEYMDRGSFDSIYKRIGPIQIEVVARVAMSVLEGLMYLYDVHRIIHRDIKPSNILCNTKGEIKLCDFGVSGELINSIANTFVGTSIYMSPERIQGAEYSVKSDIWSLGITLVELATGRFPFYDDAADDPDSIMTLNTTMNNATMNVSNATMTSPISPTTRSTLEALDEESVMIIAAATASMHLNPFSTSHPVSSATSATGGTKPIHPPPPLSPSAHTKPLRSNRRSQAHTHTRRKSNGVSLHGGGMTMSIIELMHHIVREPAPRLQPPPSAAATPTPDADGSVMVWKDAEEFVDACLEKEVDVRGTPGILLNYKWVQDTKKSTFDVAAWAQNIE